MSYGVVLTWSGCGTVKPKSYPFDTSENFFNVLYNAAFWTDGTLKTTSLFEFDSHCPDSDYIPAIQKEIGKLHKSLLATDGLHMGISGIQKNNKADQRKKLLSLMDYSRHRQGRRRKADPCCHSNR